MGFFDFFKKKNNYVPVKYEYTPQKLSLVEKELILVGRVTTEDMIQFPMIPYQLNCPIHKFIQKGSHPFAYIVLNDFNQVIAKKDLERINKYLIQACDYIKELTKDIFIEVDKVAFEEYNPNYGYTRLMCNPHTLTGRVSKYPVNLLFMTRLDVKSYTALGTLYYGKSGNVLKANITIWSRAIGWFFNFKTIGDTFTLYQAKSTIKTDKNGMAGLIYQFEK